MRGSKSESVGGAREAFARTVIAFQPYVAEIVFIGGWVHAIYLADAGTGQTPVFTDDIDVTIPPQLLAAGRPQLIDLAAEAGFELDPISDLGGSIRLVRPGPDMSVIDLDLITEAEKPGSAVAVEGQDGLIAQGYPWQQLLLDNSEWKALGKEIHPLLDPRRRIRAPTIPAYVLHKGLSSITRTRFAKKAKDLVYVHEILRHPILGQRATAGLRDLAKRYTEPWAQWTEQMESASEDSQLLGEVADQLMNADRVQGPRTVAIATVSARLKRVLAETR